MFSGGGVGELDAVGEEGVGVRWVRGLEWRVSMAVLLSRKEMQV